MHTLCVGRRRLRFDSTHFACAVFDGPGTFASIGTYTPQLSLSRTRASPGRAQLTPVCVLATAIRAFAEFSSQARHDSERLLQAAEQFLTLGNQIARLLRVDASAASLFDVQRMGDERLAQLCVDAGLTAEHVCSARRFLLRGVQSAVTLGLPFAEELPPRERGRLAALLDEATDEDILIVLDTVEEFMHDAKVSNAEDPLVTPCIVYRQPFCNYEDNEERFANLVEGLASVQVKHTNHFARMLLDALCKHHKM